MRLLAFWFVCATGWAQMSPFPGPGMPVPGGGIETVAGPASSPAAGTYSTTQTVTLTDPTSGSTICYSIDGSTPTATVPGTCDGLTYSTGLTVSATTTVKAIGTKGGLTTSGVVVSAYTISAGISLINGSNCTSGNATSSAVDARAANFAIIAVSNGLAGNGTVSDNNGNTWQKLTGAGSNPDSTLYYAKNFVGLASQTFAVAGASFPGFCVLTFSGLTTSAPFDKQTGASVTASTIHPGALTPTSANSLLVTSLSHVATSDPTTANNLGAGFIQSGIQAFAGGVSYAVGIAYLIQSGGPASVDPVWTVAASDGLGSRLAVFK